MTSQIYTLFLGQAALMVVVYAIFFRTSTVPPIIKMLVVAAYITVPAAILITGIASAIYISDLIGILLIFYFLMRLHTFSALLANRYFLTLFALLIMLPFCWGVILVLSGENVLSSRAWLDNGIWFYRNLVYVLAFGIGISQKINREQAREFIEMNLSFGALLALLGLVSYFTPLNLAIFEAIRWGGVIPVWFQESRIGLGFLGLFRGSVGQWFAVLVILAIGAYHFVSPRYRKVALIVILAGVGAILLSFSRAGFVGLIAGLAILGFSRVRNKGKMAVFAVLTVLALGLFFGGEGALRERFLPKLEQVQTVGFGEATALRLFAWERSIEFFSGNFLNFLAGIGPVEREEIHKITGIFGPHNEYLDSIFRIGFFGLLLLLWFLFVILSRFLWMRSRVESFMKPVIWSLIAIIIANSVMALTQSHLLHNYATHTLGFYLFLLYGVFIGARWDETA